MRSLPESLLPRPRAPRWPLLAVVIALHLLVWQGLRGLGFKLPEQPVEQPVMMAILIPREPTVARPEAVLPVPTLESVRLEAPQVDISVPTEVLPPSLPEVLPTPAAPQPPAALTSVPSRASGALRVDIAEIDYLRAPTPRYPPAARRLRLQGVVQLLVAVDVQGRVSAAIVQNSSGHAELDSAARQAVFDARFRPYRVDGEARAVEVLVPVQFALNAQRASLQPLEAHAPNA